MSKCLRVGNATHGEGNLRQLLLEPGTVDNEFDCNYDGDVELEYAILRC